MLKPQFTKGGYVMAMNRVQFQPGAEVYSDGLGAFGAVVNLDHPHTVIQCETPRQGCETKGARWVNVVLGNLKRALDGTYHVFCFFKYAHRYLGEAAWRFNRRFRLEAIRRLVLQGTELANAYVGTLRLKLLKVGAIILRNTRRIRFLLSSACPHQRLFFHVAARLAPG